MNLAKLASENQLVHYQMLQGVRYENMAGLRYIDGNSFCYFTMPHRSEWEMIANEYDMSGEESVNLRRMLTALHLSSQDGVPLHSVENGWFYVREYSGQPHVMMKHLRIDEEQAKQIINTCKSKEEFAAIVESHKPRWKAEAEACLNLIKEIKCKK